ncbi:class I SAM-dependent methyltransferase [Roseovarius tibetensis]|uniref:class I SAM-dependent methyltransferase n=1 Tax=Roseovarius tibetensis TaxID=2685897 RepID=UPI003D7F7157
MTKDAERSFDADEVKRICNGMLPPDVYVAMYEAARCAPETLFVEVGTAHAAGTVSLAMGLRDSGRNGKVYTFEKIVGGSREAFGGMDENIEIIRQNLKAFGVDDFVHLTIGDVAETAGVVPDDVSIGLLCLDADGAIDRDFGLFFDRLAANAPIIIDDSRDHTRIKRLGRSGLSHRFIVDQKHRLTFRLLQEFQQYGLLNNGEIYGTDTWIGRKGESHFANIPSENILGVYRSLVFTETTHSFVPFRGLLAKGLRKTLPTRLLTRLIALETGKACS